MEAIIFCGIQATGKSTFFKERFFKTHVHISLDLLRTRHRETKFLELCIQTQQAFVVDNTNPTKTERLKYIAAAKEAKFKVIGYFFQSKVSEALLRNEARKGKEKIPEIGIKGTFKRLELLEYSEGFDELYFVEIIDNQFIIKEWKNEI
jgi:predicted kinase